VPEACTVGGMTGTREATRGSEAAWWVEAQRTRWTEQIAEAVLSAQEAEGSTLLAFCQKHSLPYSRVHFWKQRRDRRRQAKPEPRVSFIPVSMGASAAPSQSGADSLELEVSGVRIHVREGASQELIARVVRALKEEAAC
jgi:transposase